MDTQDRVVGAVDKEAERYAMAINFSRVDKPTSITDTPRTADKIRAMLNRNPDMRRVLNSYVKLYETARASLDDSKQFTDRPLVEKLSVDEVREVVTKLPKDKLEKGLKAADELLVKLVEADTTEEIDVYDIDFAKAQFNASIYRLRLAT